MNSLSTINVKGTNYELVDDTARKMLVNVSNDIKKNSILTESLKEGVLEIANQVTILKQNETCRRTSLEVEDVISFPVLKFTNNFSILVDINIIRKNELYTNQQIIKCYNNKIYRNTIDGNCTVDCYYQLKDNIVYLFFDSLFDLFDLSFNVISYAGDVPKIIIDENKFSVNNYTNAIKLK